MAENAQTPKHRSAKHRWVAQRRTFNVLYYICETRSNKHVPHGVYQAGPRISVPVPLRQIGIRLARRRCVDRIELRDKSPIQAQCVGLNKLERILRLGSDIDTDNLEARSLVSDASTTGAAKQIQ